MAAFPTPQQAVDTALRIAAVADPAAVELMDRTCIRAVNRQTRMGLDESAGALLLIQCDGPSAGQEAATCARPAEAAGATEVLHTADPADGEMFMQARRTVYPALERLGTTLLDDVGVAVQDLPGAASGIRRRRKDTCTASGTAHARALGVCPVDSRAAVRSTVCPSLPMKSMGSWIPRPSGREGNEAPAEQGREGRFAARADRPSPSIGRLRPLTWELIECEI
ncbi:FAD-binding oxidoreductase [Streptomyces sp. HUAS TT20]|uniref:FAD-binding oxidoreductase n=1 Tax=Streptomyces sp. HUAS TT20 TaxID=3447509 RepID=UPI0021DA3502|nr:FAD-linked oxidase C-terminal domain-containing protein [Streptomyces sp. HUAS 15-9]UXY32062.1 hypothetical protein N8I87_39600 [Streptomyces sp. HUAS 15-9]